MGLVYSALTLSDTFVSITAMLLVSRPLASPILSCFLQYFLVRLYFTINIVTNVRKKHLPFIKVRVRIFINDQVAETCDACDRTEDLRALRFSIYADFYSR